MDRVISSPQSKHFTAQGIFPTWFAKDWSEACKQKDEEGNEEVDCVQEGDLEKFLWGKEITTELEVSFIWAEVMDLGIGALGVSMNQSVGNDRFSHLITQCSIF